jgi:8-oxo-dGTP diphosphatase
VTERLRVCSYALLVDRGRILLCRISDALPESVGKWTLPGGGLDFGESPQDAAVREVREETGLEVDVMGIETVDSQVYEFGGERLHIIRHVYRAHVTGGELRSETEGSTDIAQWFTRSQAENLPLVEIAALGVEMAFAPRH